MNIKWAPAQLGSKQIDGLLVPPGKASSLLTDHLITYWLTAHRKSGSGQTIHIYNYRLCRYSWVVIFEVHFGCHDVLILGESPIKWRQRPDMAISY